MARYPAVFADHVGVPLVEVRGQIYPRTKVPHDVPDVRVLHAPVSPPDGFQVIHGGDGIRATAIPLDPVGPVGGERLKNPSVPYTYIRVPRAYTRVTRVRALTRVCARNTNMVSKPELAR